MRSTLDIAVIGSGIAGLSAAWFLGKKHRVTLYERWPRLGMDAHTVQVDASDPPLPVNTPMRVFFPEYYPGLTALYDEIGAAYTPVKYSGSFSQFGGKTFFRYKNYWIGSRSVPMLAAGSLVSPAALKISRELLRFLKPTPADRSGGIPNSMSLQDYLQREGYSRLFAEQFLYPSFAGICTCSYDSIRAYPASVIREYLTSGLIGSRVNRLVHGTQDAAQRLAAAAHRVRLGTPLQAVTRRQNHVDVTDSDGQTEAFDHVVVATQANQALRLLAQPTAAEKTALSKFRYEPSQIVVHRDRRLAPQRESTWAPVNFLLSENQDKPMASILLNSIHPQLQGHDPLFETWNPFVDPAADKTLLEASLERPVVSQESLAGIGELEALHAQADRRLWFCGSYARRGIPLLESAVASARAVADRVQAVDQQPSRAARRRAVSA